MHTATETAQSLVLDAIERAGQSLGYHDHFAVGMTEGRRMPQRAESRVTIDLASALMLPPLTGEVISPTSPAKSVNLNAALIATSRVAQAGTRIVVAKDRPQSMPELSFYSDAGLFRIVERAEFAVVADGASAVAGDLSILDAPIRWADAPSAAFTTTITRRQQKDTGGADLAAQLIHAIFAGIAVEADRVLLSAIAAANPGAFTLGAAAARGLRYEELAGFIGIAGAGATVDAAGTLRCAGIASELTQTTALSLVGAFNRSAVAIRPEVAIHFRRLTVEGDLECACFINMIGLVPDASAFWKVTAA